MRTKIGFLAAVLFFAAFAAHAAENKSPADRAAAVQMDASDFLIPVPAAEWPRVKDDGDLSSLIISLKESVNYFNALPPETSLVFGKEKLKAADLAASYTALHEFLAKSPSEEEISQYLRENFRLLTTRASLQNPDPVVFTAYYEHSLSASLTKTETFIHPIYSRPPELIDVECETFDPRRKGERWVGRAEGGKLIPYYSRKEIDRGGALKGRGLEIAWAKDSLDITFLQIQGSGWLNIEGSTEPLHIRYAGDNGLTFRSIGLYLIERGSIERKDFTRERMVNYLNQLSATDKEDVLFQNPRYIFFEIVSSTNLTRGSLMVPLTAGRSVATDPKFYPRGALLWLQTELPAFNERGERMGRKPLKRLVLNQDEGNAIKGPHRVDYFVGGSGRAEQTAQNMMNPGKLYLLLSKPKK